MKRTFESHDLIVAILVIAITLRFFNLFELPFTHDEFSTLFRTNFSSFHELIEKGVKVDTHPAGLQVFVYYYKQLFGTEEWVIKIPFLLFGIGSVWLIYLIFNKWYNHSVALICATYVATLQYTVMYSQIARPYSSGLFLILALVYFWNRIFFERKFSTSNYISYVLIASLCLYNHHFSALLAVIISLTGLCFLPKNQLWKYSIVGLAIFACYAPHIPVFFAQLKLGGLGDWLNKPTPEFLWYYLQYVFQFSTVSVILPVLLMLFSLTQFNKSAYFSKATLVSVLWFFTPLFVGYFYSIVKAPVLQYSVLIFSFPFLFPVIFGGLKNQRQSINIVLIGIIACVNIYVLIYNRNHYEIFYNSIYKNIIKDYRDTKETKTVAIIDAEFLHRKIERHYLKKWHIDSNFTWMDSFPDFLSFQHFLKQSSLKHDKLYLGAVFDSHPLIVPLIKEFYPKIVFEHRYASGSTYLFSKGKATELVFSEMNFKRNKKGWTKLELISSYIHNNCFEMDSTIEYSPTFELPLNQITNNDDDYIDVSVQVKQISTKIQASLVSSIDTPTKNIDWRGTDFFNFIDTTRIDTNWVTIHHSIKLSDINLREKGMKLKILVWSPNKDHYFIKDFKIKIRKGNPKIYGFFNPF